MLVQTQDASSEAVVNYRELGAVKVFVLRSARLKKVKNAGFDK